MVIVLVIILSCLSLSNFWGVFILCMISLLLAHRFWMPLEASFSIKSHCFLCHPYRSWEFHDRIKYQCPGGSVPKGRRFWRALIYIWNGVNFVSGKSQGHAGEQVCLNKPVYRIATARIDFLKLKMLDINNMGISLKNATSRNEASVTMRHHHDVSLMCHV